MNRLLCLHIHSCFASVSSEDKFLYKVVPPTVRVHHRGSREFARQFARLDEDDQRHYSDAPAFLRWPGDEVTVVSEINTDVKGWTVYYTADTEYYWIGLLERGLKHYDLSEKVSFYTTLMGFAFEEPADYKALYEAHCAAEKATNIALRTTEQYVFPETTIVPRAAMQGGLSNTVFNAPALVEYTTPREDGKVYAFGYIGNSNRRIPLDRFLENHVLDTLNWSVEDFAVWLTSTDGRHMADSYESEDDCVKWCFRNFAAAERAGLPASSA